MLCVFPMMRKPWATLSRDFVALDSLRETTIWLMVKSQKIGGKWLSQVVILTMALNVSDILQRSLQSESQRRTSSASVGTTI